MKRILVLLLLLGCTAVYADPVSLIAFAVVEGFKLVGIKAFLVYATAALIGGAVARKRQRAAAKAARDAYNANLTARNQTFLSDAPSPQIIYGEPPPVGGAVVAQMYSGERDQYQHIVVVYAMTAITAIDGFLIEGEDVGTLDVDGYPVDGPFVETLPTEYATVQVTFDGAGAATIARDDWSFSDMLTAGATAKFNGFVGLAYFTSKSPSADTEDISYVVTYSYDEVTGVTTCSGGPADTTVTVTTKTARRTPRVRIRAHINGDGVPDADLMAACPDQWTAQHKLQGRTYVVYTFDLDFPRFQQGMPNVSIRAKGKACYDPRTGLTVYTRNPALCWADFIVGKYGYGAAYGQLDETALIAAANACDENIYLTTVYFSDVEGWDRDKYYRNLGGSLARYTCDGAFKLEEGRETTKNAIEGAMAGNGFDSGGVWVVNAGVWTTPLFTLNPTDLRAPVDIIQNSYPGNERFNSMRGRYVNCMSNGVAEDITPYQNTTLVSSDGKEKWGNLPLPFTSSFLRATQLCRIKVEQSRLGMIVQVTPTMTYWKAQPGNRFYLNDPLLNIVNKPFRIQDWAHAPGQPVSFIAIEDVATSYDLFDINTIDPAPNAVAQDFRAVENLTFNGEPQSGTNYLVKQSDGSIITNVFVPIVPATKRNVTHGGSVEMKWRRATDTTGEWLSLPPLDGGSRSGMISNAQDSTVIVIGARFSSDIGRKGAWNYITHEVVGKRAPPSDITSASISADGIATWKHVTDIDRAGYVIRWQPGVNRSWGDAAKLHEGIITDSPYPIKIRPIGQATFMFKAVDTSKSEAFPDGNESLNAAVVITDLGDPIVNNVVLSYDFQGAAYPGAYTNASISGGDLVADADASPLGWDADDNTAGWTDDAALAWTASTYKPVTYETSIFTVGSGDAGAQLTLDTSITALAYAIEYRIDGDVPGWDVDSAPGWTSDTDLAWTDTPYQAWPGAVVSRAVRYQWRVTTQSIETQSVISTFAANLDVEDQTEVVGYVAISAGGTIIPTTKTWRAVTNIGMSLVADGGTAENLRIEDYTTRLVTARDGTNAAVAGAGLFTLQGY